MKLFGFIVYGALRTSIDVQDWWIYELKQVEIKAWYKIYGQNFAEKQLSKLRGMNKKSIMTER
ncbi:MAG: hypothetical protein ACXW0Q_07455 [Methylovulum sp.]